MTDLMKIKSKFKLASTIFLSFSLYKFNIVKSKRKQQLLNIQETV